MPRWTPESRAEQAQAIRRWRPWELSTGPKTEAGKRRSRENRDRYWEDTEGTQRTRDAVAGVHSSIAELCSLMARL